MLKRIRSGLTYANVMSTLAVFLILGGATAFAASQLGKNSVGTNQLKKSAVSAAKIKDSAVNSAKVADESLTGADVAKGSLTGANIAARSIAGANLADGSVGLANLAPDSVDGAKVVDGSLGGADVKAGTFVGAKITTQFSKAVAPLADGTKASYDVFCPAGQIALGGGGRGDDLNSELTNFSSSRPAKTATDTNPPISGGTFTGWRITVSNPAGGAVVEIFPEVWAICAALP